MLAFCALKIMLKKLVVIFPLEFSKLNQNLGLVSYKCLVSSFVKLGQCVFALTPGSQSMMFNCLSPELKSL